jgi:hypothetical protein
LKYYLFFIWNYDDFFFIFAPALVLKSASYKRGKRVIGIKFGGKFLRGCDHFFLEEAQEERSLKEMK